MYFSKKSKCYNIVNGRNFDMKAAIITIGDEILLGQILDTNSRFIARELARLGAETIEMCSIADEHGAIVSALANSLAKADAVFITGGLGPTKDDITKQALADFFHTSLIPNAQAAAWLEEFFKDRPERMNACNQTQALLPANCVPLRNLKGTACGMWFEYAGKVVVSLPGVPFETEYLFPAEVLPRLKAKFADLHLQYKMVTVYDIPEAELAMRLAKFEKNIPPHMGLAYLPSPGYVRLRLTAKDEASAQLPDVYSDLLSYLKGLSFSAGEEESFEQQIADRLRQSGKTVACAESCTGGNISHLITSIPGSSSYFLGGIVSYANEVKINVLGVNPQDLKTHGAVSEPVARQMAEGARRVTGADWAVATTGIAGPDGGTPEKPVGTVWIAVAGPHGTQAKKFLFSHTRERNIGRASNAALRWLAEEIMQTK